MKIKISKSSLQSGMSRTQGALSEKNMGQVQISAKDGVLRFTAKDNILAVYCSFKCEVGQQGEVTVHSKVFSDIVRELPVGDAQLFVSGTNLIIQAGEAFEIKIPLVEDDVRVDPPQFNVLDTVRLSTEKLSYMIDQVQFCITQEGTPAYSAVGYLHKVGNTLRIVGSDGYRLSISEVENIELPDSFLKTGICLTKRALNEISRMCSEPFDELELSIAENGSTVKFSVEGYEIYSRVSSVKYPKYEGVLPPEHPLNFSFSRPQFQSVTKRVLLAADKSRVINLNFLGSSLTLSSRTIGGSEGKETIELQNFDSPECRLAFNGKFLTDVFATTASGKLSFEYADHDTPVVIRPLEEPFSCSSKHVLVPIKEGN